jgi:hypothetical protein
MILAAGGRTAAPWPAGAGRPPPGRRQWAARWGRFCWRERSRTPVEGPATRWAQADRSVERSMQVSENWIPPSGRRPVRSARRLPTPVPSGSSGNRWTPHPPGSPRPPRDTLSRSRRAGRPRRSPVVRTQGANNLQARGRLRLHRGEHHAAGCAHVELISRPSFPRKAAMPHPAPWFPGPAAPPCFGSGRGDAADRVHDDRAPGRRVAGKVCCRMWLSPSKAAGTRRKRGRVRSAGAWGVRGGAIRIVHGRRVIAPRSPGSASPAAPLPAPRPRPLETRPFRFLLAGG